MPKSQKALACELRVCSFPIGLGSNYLAEHHYLGFGGTAGQNLRYFIRDCYGRDLACVLFGCAAWKVKARDRFIKLLPELVVFFLA
jgi:hypothetical protein